MKAERVLTWCTIVNFFLLHKTFHFNRTANHTGFMNYSLYSTGWFPILVLRVAGRSESEREVVSVRLLKGCRDWLVPSEDLRLSISVCIDACIWVCVCVCLHLPVCFHPLGYSVVYAPSLSSVWRTMTTKGGRGPNHGGDKSGAE